MTEIIIAAIGYVSAVSVAIISNIASNKKLEKKIDDLARHEKENYLTGLRLTIMSNEMPDSERIIAGNKYLMAGGNGDVKHFYMEFVKTHTKNGQ